MLHVAVGLDSGHGTLPDLTREGQAGSRRAHANGPENRADPQSYA